MQDMSLNSTEDALKALRIVELTIKQADKEMVSRMDQLYNHGKEKGWPKDVMHYLMWWEHEAIRIPWRLRSLDPKVSEIRKGLNVSGLENGPS